MSTKLSDDRQVKFIIMNVIERYEPVLPVHGDRNCAHSRLGCRGYASFPSSVAARTRPKPFHAQQSAETSVYSRFCS